MSQTISSSASLEAADNKFPSQIKYIVGNEACERYSYYGMKSILTVFMIQVLLFQEADATFTYHIFSSLCYFFPVLGAFISDRIWGKYKTILYLSLVYCAGHAVLSIWENSTGLYVGLGLIALGSGGIKPCVSAHVGDQFKANGCTGLQLEQDVEHGVGVLAARDADHDLVALFDHVEVHDGAADFPAQALL